MLGRQNKELILRLLKVSPHPKYHIIVTRKRSKGTARLDRIGSFSSGNAMGMLKLDNKKLNKYLMEKNVAMTPTVAKVLNLDFAHIKELIRYKKKRYATQRQGIVPASFNQRCYCEICEKRQMDKKMLLDEFNEKLKKSNEAENEIQKNSKNWLEKTKIKSNIITKKLSTKRRMLIKTKNFRKINKIDKFIKKYLPTKVLKPRKTKVKQWKPKPIKNPMKIILTPTYQENLNKIVELKKKHKEEKEKRKFKNMREIQKQINVLTLENRKIPIEFIWRSPNSKIIKKQITDLPKKNQKSPIKIQKQIKIMKPTENKKEPKKASNLQKSVKKEPKKASNLQKSVKKETKKTSTVMEKPINTTKRRTSKDFMRTHKYRNPVAPERPWDLKPTKKSKRSNQPRESKANKTTKL